MDVLVAPLIVFLVIVAPIWVVMHYQSKKRSVRQLSDDELQTMEKMLETFDKLAARIETLESILDKEHENWRQHEKNQ